MPLFERLRTTGVARRRARSSRRRSPLAPMPSALRFVVASAATVGLGASRRAPGARARGVLSNASSLAELTPSATVSELGIDRLASIAGGTPVSWEERQLARILESTGQDDSSRAWVVPSIITI